MSQPLYLLPFRRRAASLTWLTLLLLVLLTAGAARAQRRMEKLNRGVVAVRTGTSAVYVGWRVLGTEPAGLAFNVYRGTTRLNAAPITGATNLTDNTAANEPYTVRAVLNGVEQPASEAATVWAQPWLRIPLQRPAGGTTPSGETYTYSANDCSVGDVDGDGQYEIILKWDPSNAKDNAQAGYTGNVYLDAYRLDGTRLWRIDLGRNIRAGAHYTQFMVYDFDSDGKAEVACKTADGT
ncbi:MAG: rhamnogalacturonan lyase, partial [Hymenobacter sp.]|nr:rhamnogalacturonan lyase [Hymenobacter sp.]